MPPDVIPERGPEEPEAGLKTHVIVAETPDRIGSRLAIALLRQLVEFVGEHHRKPTKQEQRGLRAEILRQEVALLPDELAALIDLEFAVALPRVKRLFAAEAGWTSR